MILVDSSLWIDHLRSGHRHLEERLLNHEVLSHPFITGELACGNLKARSTILKAMDDLPSAKLASNSEVRRLIERHHLMGRGLGYIDVHLLASALLTPHTLLWTRDKRLNTIAGELSIAHRAH